MATTAKATGFLELNISGFDQALKTAKNLMAAFAAGLAAYKVGSFFTDGIKDAIDFGKEMQSISRTMGGFDPGALLLAQKGLEKAGMGAAEAQGHIKDFIEEGRDVAQLFGGADNYAAALKSAAKDYGDQAAVLHRSAAFLQTVWNTMEAIGSKIRTFFLTMTEQFVGPLQVALDYLNQIDLAGVGESFGKAISDAANTLFGIFKNGDIFEVTKLGLTVAFQEAVNWLVGGLNYIGNLSIPFLGEQLGKAFIYALDILEKGWKILSDNFPTIGEAFVGIGTKFTVAIMEGLNTVFRYMQAGVQSAVQAAIESIPGASEFLGVGGAQHEDFDELLGKTSNIIPQDFIDSIKGSGKDITDGFGGGIKKFADGLFKTGEAGKFEKGSVFDTSEDSKKLADMIANGFKTGTEMVAGAQKGNNNAAPKNVLTSFSGSSSKVIADSLARVGGGGGFLRQGMTLQERTQLQIALATKQTAAATQALLNESKTRKPQPQSLGR